MPAHGDVARKRHRQATLQALVGKVLPVVEVRRPLLVVDDARGGGSLEPDRGRIVLEHVEHTLGIRNQSGGKELLHHRLGLRQRLGPVVLLDGHHVEDGGLPLCKRGVEAGDDRCSAPGLPR